VDSADSKMKRVELNVLYFLAFLPGVFVAEGMITVAIWCVVGLLSYFIVMVVIGRRVGRHRWVRNLVISMIATHLIGIEIQMHMRHMLASYYILTLIIITLINFKHFKKMTHVYFED